MKNIIALTGLDSTSLTASDEAKGQRDELLVAARAVTVVTTPEQAQEAGQALTALKTFTRSIEDTRGAVKSPVLDLAKRIDALAKELTVEAEEEAARIGRMVGAFNLEQARIADRKRRDAEAAEQKIIDDTRQKLRDAQAAGASDKKLDKIEDTAVKNLMVAKATTAAAVAPKIAGVSTRQELCFEVLDMAALQKAYPMLVTVTPNNAAIKASLKNLPNGLPGVRHWYDTKAIVR